MCSRLRALYALVIGCVRCLVESLFQDGAVFAAYSDQIAIVRLQRLEEVRLGITLHMRMGCAQILTLAC